MEFSNMLLLMLGIVAMIVIVALLLGAAITMLRSDMTVTAKVAWLVVLVAFPIIGVIAWYLAGERTPRIERELGLRKSY